MIKQIFLGQKFGDNPMSDMGLIIMTILICCLYGLLILVFGFAKLSTMIDKNGITFKFFPFHLKWRFIPWQEIDRYEVVVYNPIKDYGGWGIKYGRKGKAFNVSGDRGLSINLKSGKNILIGTQRDNELKEYLENM